MAGQKFDTPQISNTPLIHYLLTHTAMAGRPGAGPALSLSLVLVAIVCVFTGLCYAELASMIPTVIGTSRATPQRLACTDATAGTLTRAPRLKAERATPGPTICDRRTA